MDTGTSIVLSVISVSSMDTGTRVVLSVCKTVSSMDTRTWRKGGKPPKARRGYHPAVSSTLMFRATNYTY